MKTLRFIVGGVGAAFLILLGIAAVEPYADGYMAALQARGAVSHGVVMCGRNFDLEAEAIVSGSAGEMVFVGQRTSFVKERLYDLKLLLGAEVPTPLYWIAQNGVIQQQFRLGRDPYYRWRIVGSVPKDIDDVRREFRRKALTGQCRGGAITSVVSIPL